MMHYITGGAKSGKSAYAESLIHAQSEQPSADDVTISYIATASKRDNDDEMDQKIHIHQARRPKAWQLVETPLYVSQSLRERNHPNAIVLVDCITLYVTNWFFHPERERLWADEYRALRDVAASFSGQLYLVSNEIGSGVVPMGVENREFVELAGQVNQDLAACSQRASLVVSGLPISLKDRL
jgi:adenosylcobinamide kinase / adenosylcobinamide-phosphate guanylyltransferase